MANNIAVKVTADVADLTAKRAVMSAELKAATKDLNDFARTARSGGMTAELRAGMLSSAEAVGKAKNSIALLDLEMKKLKVDAAEAGAGMFTGIGRGLESVKAGAESMRALRASITAVGEAVIAAFAIERVAEWARKMGEAGEKTEHTAQILGATVSDVQRVNAAFALTGVDAEKGVLAIERLDKAFAQARQGGRQQIAAFEELGVSTTRNYTQMQLLGAVMDGFAKQADGPAKAAEAMQVLGRAGAAMIPFLDLGAAGMATINQLTEKYGVVNEDAVAKSALLGEAFNENKVAMSGAGNVLAQEFAPALTVAVQAVNDLIASWVRSYKEGGDVKTILDALDFALKQLIAACADVGIVFDEVFQAIKLLINGFRDSWQLAVDGVEGGAKVVGDEFVALGQVIHDALTLNILAAARDLKSAEDKIAADTAATAAKIRGDMARLAKDTAPEWAKMKDDAAGYLKFLDSLGAGHPKGAPIKPTGEGQGDTSGSAFGGGGHGPSIVSTWTEQLHAMEIASGEFFRDQTQGELAFWQGKLALTKAGSKDWLAVHEKIFTAQRTLAHQAYEDHIATLNDQLEADHGEWAKEQADWNAKLTFIKAHYGAESAEFKNAHREFERAERDHEDKMAQIRRDAAQGKLSELREGLRVEQEMRQESARTQEAVIASRSRSSANPFAEIAAERQLAQLRRQAIEEQIAALGQEYLAQSQITARELSDTKRALGEESQQYQKLIAEKSRLDAQYYGQRRVLVDRAANEEVRAQQRVTQAWHSSVDPMVQAAGSELKGLIEETTTWRQALLSIGDALLGVVIGALEKVAERMIVNAIVGKTAQVASAESGVAAAAALAGANGVASMAGAPFPIDLGAPAFGASMAATAAAFGALGAFEKGMDVVPQDMVAQIHAGERIVPAADNRKIISALDGGGAGGGRGPRGGMHLHVHLPNGMSRRDGERVSRDLMDGLKSEIRKDPGLRRAFAGAGS